MAARGDVRDFVKALEEQSLDCLEAIQARRDDLTGAFPYAEYRHIKTRIQNFSALYDRLDEKLAEVAPARRLRLRERFQKLDARITALFVDLAVRFICSLTARPDLPLGIYETCLRELTPIRHYIERLRLLDATRYLERADPLFLDAVDDIVREIGQRVPPLEEFVDAPAFPKRQRPMPDWRLG
jgi:hypothetical protein